jgi:hypothetical protein
MAGSLDCEICVEGHDRGKMSHGRPVKSLYRPVREFLRNSDHYYRAVTQHLRKCDICEPAEALLGFLENRKIKNHGMVSNTLMEMAERYQKIFPGRIPDEIIREYTTRSLDNGIDRFLSRINILDEFDIRRAIQILEDKWRSEIKKILSIVRGEMQKENIQVYLIGRYEHIVEMYPAYIILQGINKVQNKDIPFFEQSGDKRKFLLKEVRKYSQSWLLKHGGQEWKELNDRIMIMSIMNS